jgi:hypothetical protein
VSRAALIAAVSVLASCAIADHGIAFDEDARDAHREALTEWCHMVGPCVPGASGLMPAPGVTLPAYTEECGYLPPVYGTDC